MILFYTEVNRLTSHPFWRRYCLLDEYEKNVLGKNYPTLRNAPTSETLRSVLKDTTAIRERANKLSGDALITQPDMEDNRWKEQLLSDDPDWDRAAKDYKSIYQKLHELNFSLQYYISEAEKAKDNAWEKVLIAWAIISTVAFLVSAIWLILTR